jgi:glycosyltransferase involved in cell wall biosynthesis
MGPVRASVILLTYNQEAFVEEALRSLLDQDYDNLEIVVSDDGSVDATWRVIRQIVASYRGNKKIILNQNERNIGIVGNYFKAFTFTTGDVIFTAAGDDVSLPNRCSACINTWIGADRIVDLIAADGYDMLLTGEVAGLKETDELSKWTFQAWTERRPFMFGASHMMTRRLLMLRTLDPRLPVEDQNLVARALMMGGAQRLAVPLIMHRRGGFSQIKYKFNYQEKKRMLIKSANESLLERAEILLDAALLGKQVERYLLTQYSLANYIVSMFQNKSFVLSLETFIRFSNVPFWKRVRFFQFAVFPKFNSRLIELKSTRSEEK